MRVKKLLVSTLLVSFAAPALADDPLPPPPPTTTNDRARFSGKRLAVEMLAGAAVGGLVGYGVFEATGGDDIGSALMGLGANIAVTPIVVWGTGRAMGGDGSLGWTYVGGLVAFSGPSATPEQAALSLALGSVFLPITSSIMYEVSSHARWSRRVAATAMPVVDGNGLAGVRVGVGFGF